MVDKSTEQAGLTLEMLNRELDKFKELIDSRIREATSPIVARLDGMDKAVAKIEQYPTVVDKGFLSLRELLEEKINHLQDVHEQKICGVHSVLRERDNQRNVIAESQKEARDKSEVSTTKQMDSLGEQIGTVSRVLDSKIDDLKTRIQAMEGRM